MTQGRPAPPVPYMKLTVATSLTAWKKMPRAGAGTSPWLGALGRRGDGYSHAPQPARMARWPRRSPGDEARTGQGTRSATAWPSGPKSLGVLSTKSRGPLGEGELM